MTNTQESSEMSASVDKEFSDYVFRSYHRILLGIEIQCEIPAMHCGNMLALLTLTQGAKANDNWHNWETNWYAKRILEHSANARDRRATAKDLLGIL
jgi:hypothetical protein